MKFVMFHISDEMYTKVRETESLLWKAERGDDGKKLFDHFWVKIVGSDDADEDPVKMAVAVKRVTALAATNAFEKVATVNVNEVDDLSYKTQSVHYMWLDNPEVVWVEEKFMDGVRSTSIGDVAVSETTNVNVVRVHMMDRFGWCDLGEFPASLFA